MKKETIEVRGWNSTCLNCHHGCDPSQASHESRLGYGVQTGEKGCGITWKYITTGYTDMEYRVKEMRPDLEFIGYFEAHGPEWPIELAMIVPKLRDLMEGSQTSSALISVLPADLNLLLDVAERVIKETR